MVLRPERLASRLRHRNVGLGRGRIPCPVKKALCAGLLLVAARMVSFHHRLYCLEADGKMGFGVKDVLLVPAHVEERIKAGTGC